MKVTGESEHTVTVGNRTLHKKDVAEIPHNLVKELFQCTKAKPKNVPKYIKGEKKTVYTKNGRFTKKGTEGATAYTVHTLGEEKTKENRRCRKDCKKSERRDGSRRRSNEKTKRQREKLTNFS